MLSEWLEHSLDKASGSHPRGPVAGGGFQVAGPGLLELTPAKPAAQAPAVIISVGIHGNETAPIELLGASLARLEAGLLTLGAPVLLMLGNLDAIRAGTRYVHTNLNRLFRRDLAETGDEAERARALMRAVDAFFARHPDRPRLHYDLHTAIRDSQYPRFVVEPFADTPTEPAQWQWLAGADMQAVLHQHKHSWTFSHYSRHYHQAQAFTIELGRALPFGHNDLAPLEPMGRLLDALLEGRPPSTADASRMAYFRVEHELMRHSDDFRLCFDEATPNFTAFPPGTHLAEDAREGDFVVGDTPLHVVFPNAEVELGARAALLVTPTTAPTAEG